LATFTLRQLIDSATPITVGDLELSNFQRDGSSNVSASSVVIETIEGDEPGLIIRTNAPLSSSDAARTIGFQFRATADGAIIEGASLSLDDVTFSSLEAGGSVEATIVQGGPNDNLNLNAVIDNAAGVADTPTDASDITDGPVSTFRFEYDLSLIPENGVTTTFDESTLQFDLLDNGGVLPPGSTASSTSPPTPT
jgi:hypothetical protein